MAKARPTIQKRARESAKMEKRRLKQQRREERKASEDAEGEAIPDGVDPDLVGIVAGPQPPQAHLGLGELE